MKECDNCGETIGEKRLKALPHTTLCVQCQQGRENSGEFVKTTMEVHQTISGWQFEGVEQTIVKGDS